jgi:hypothetical protein
MVGCRFKMSILEVLDNLKYAHSLSVLLENVPRGWIIRRQENTNGEWNIFLDYRDYEDCIPSGADPDLLVALQQAFKEEERINARTNN